MTSLLIALMGVLVVPLLTATWRGSLLGLSLQGLLLAWIAWRWDGGALTAESALALVDLGLLRGLLAPGLLYRVLASRRTPPRNDLLPPNLLAWTGVGVLVLLGFRLAALLVPLEGELQTLVAVAVCGVLLGFLVLSTQVGVFSQMVGVLRIENGVALLEIALHPPGSIGLHVGQLAIYLTSVLFLRAYLDRLAPDLRGAP